MGAESLVAEWMRHLGAQDAEVTRYSGDGGIDVACVKFIAQVKHYTQTAPIAAVREMAGVTSVDGRLGLFFTSGTYSAEAAPFADRAAIALFVYSPELGTLKAGNLVAARYLALGLFGAEQG